MNSVRIGFSRLWGVLGSGVCCVVGILGSWGVMRWWVLGLGVGVWGV